MVYYNIRLVKKIGGELNSTAGLGQVEVEEVELVLQVEPAVSLSSWLC